MAKNRQDEASSWTTVLWTSAVALIGFGFAVCRYLQFEYGFDVGTFNRLSRIELYIYRATGHWGIIIIFLIMGLLGLVQAIMAVRELRRK